MNILHEAEHRIEQFEVELSKYKNGNSNRLYELQKTLIEEDIGFDQELVPKAKPKWNPIPKWQPKAATKSPSENLGTTKNTK